MKIKLHIKLHSSSDPEISGQMDVPMTVVESRFVLCCLALLIKAQQAHILALFAQYFEYYIFFISGIGNFT